MSRRKAKTRTPYYIRKARSKEYVRARNKAAPITDAFKIDVEAIGTPLRLGNTHLRSETEAYDHLHVAAPQSFLSGSVQSSIENATERLQTHADGFFFTNRLNGTFPTRKRCHANAQALYAFGDLNVSYKEGFMGIGTDSLNESRWGGTIKRYSETRPDWIEYVFYHSWLEFDGLRSRRRGGLVAPRQAYGCILVGGVPTGWVPTAWVLGSDPADSQSAWAEFEFGQF